MPDIKSADMTSRKNNACTDAGPVRDAVLILAHENSYCLEKLISALDDDCFDIFIHVDAKAKHFDFERCRAVAKHAVIRYTRRRKVRWGTPSLVKAELELYEAASAHGPYRYYHLVSGADLPVLPARELYDRFEGCSECFIIALTELSYDTRVRLMFYHPTLLRPHPKAPATALNRLRDFLYRAAMAVQRAAKTNRLTALQTRLGKPAKGHQWASLPQKAVDIILSRKRDICRFTAATVCSDEMYKQTVLANTPGAPALSAEGDLRFIDWSDGLPNPADIGPEHFADIDTSGAVFARKFADNAVIDAFINRKRGHADNGTAS